MMDEHNIEYMITETSDAIRNKIKDEMKKYSLIGQSYGYEQGEKEGHQKAWKLVRNLLSLSHEELHEIFWTSNMKYIVEHYDYCEVVEKIEKHEEQQKHTDRSCDSCKFEDRAIGEEPCKNCKHSYMDEWKAKR